MDLTLYPFSKRRNSTARPTGGTAFDGVLRESCDSLSPSIGIDMGQGTSPTAWNYAYLPSFGRYYFITSWTWESGLWWANMSVDVLASWKLYIGASSNYVLRAAAESDGTVVDCMYPMVAKHSISVTEFRVAWDVNTGPNTGYYIIGVVSYSSIAVGATAYYCLTPAQFRAFMYAMLSTSDWTGMTFGEGGGLSADGISENLYKSLFNPFQYVVSCVWVPVAPVLGDTTNIIALGWWGINATASLVTSPRATYTYYINLPVHPQASTRGAYLNRQPYSHYSLHVAAFGSYPMNPASYPSGIAEISVSFDFITGSAILRSADRADLNTPNGDVVAVEQVGVPIQIAQVTQDMIRGGANAVGGVLGAIGSALTGNFAGAIQSGASGVMSAVEGYLPQVRTSGANGSWAGFGQTSWIQGDFEEIAAEDNATLGRPLCKIRTLSTLAGYQLIASPDVEAPCSDRELEEINNYLTTGYYYE